MFVIFAVRATKRFTIKIRSCLILLSFFSAAVPTDARELTALCQAVPERAIPAAKRAACPGIEKTVDASMPGYRTGGAGVAFIHVLGDSGSVGSLSFNAVTSYTGY